jgi:hypothetical protein
MGTEEGGVMKNAIFVLMLAASCVVTVSVSAQTPADYEAVRNHVTCYPFGIDRIGRGEFDSGLSGWKRCFSSDFQFTVYLGRGEPTVCPGTNCPMPKEMNGVEMRAAYARRAFETSGYTKTSHHLTNVTVSFASPDRATVNAYLQAWHWKPDGTVIVGAGIWDVEVVRSGTAWQIAREKLTIVGSGSLQPPVR